MMKEARGENQGNTERSQPVIRAAGRFVEEMGYLRSTTSCPHLRHWRLPNKHSHIPA